MRLRSSAQRLVALRSVASAVASAVLAVAPPSAAEESAHRGAKREPLAGEAAPWCAPEVEALAGDVCHLDGGADGPRRTLVIFLHGAVAKNTTWQWNHMRGLLRLATAHRIDVLFPRAPLREVGYVWPGSAKAQEDVEAELIDRWTTAKHTLEQRSGRAFDEVLVMGFSSGAYFVSSLAMRGRLDVDGYAVFAGGQPSPARVSPEKRWAPVFVGVCADDPTSAPHSRAFAAALSAAGIPRVVSEQHVGHGLSHVHFNAALSYLRNAAARARAGR